MEKQQLRIGSQGIFYLDFLVKLCYTSKREVYICDYCNAKTQFVQKYTKLARIEMKDKYLPECKMKEK